jgi:hypothetical protein
MVSVCFFTTVSLAPRNVETCWYMVSLMEATGLFGFGLEGSTFSTPWSVLASSGSGSVVSMMEGPLVYFRGQNANLRRRSNGERYNTTTTVPRLLLSIDWYMNANINSAGAGLRLLNARSVLG